MIQTAQTVPHMQKAKVRSADEYLAWATQKVAHLLASGRDVEMHEDPEPRVARIDESRWLIDCECGAGNLVDPAWPVAACAACGAIHRTIVWPTDRLAIEAALEARPHLRTRFWFPRETVEDLLRENEEHGVKEKR